MRTVILAASALASVAAAQEPKRITLSPASPKLRAEAKVSEWQRARFGVLATELSPAVLVLCRTNAVGFFRNLPQWGLGAPTFAAVPTRSGVRVVRRGQAVPLPMSEGWLLCWFNGALGWTHWDAPILVVLQHRPSAAALSSDGLTLRFPAEAGLTAVMPLYGQFKVPLTRDRDYLERHGLKSKGVHTDAWSRGLPKSIVERCRYFARVLRMFPVHCREEFALDGDDLVVRATLSWLPIKDDWRTRPLKFAPLPPTLALAWWAGRNVAKRPFPMKLSHPVKDPDLFTMYGPFAGVEGQDGYTIRMSVLQYVHQALRPQPPDAARPTVAAVLKLLQTTLARKFRTSRWEQIWDHGGAGNYCWQVMGDRWYAKTIPYLTPEVQERVRAVLTGYLREFILHERRYRPFRGMLLLVGPGIGTWGGYDDAGKFSSNLLETLWNFAHYAGGWEAIRERWALIKRFFITPLESDWKSFGRYAIAEMGDEASPPLAMARLAHHLGDHDTYAFACYIFARELIHHYVKQVGAPYFRANQPCHSDELMPREVYLTNMWGDVAGWQIDGPHYPQRTGERQFNNRWVRFSCQEVGWFYQDVLPKEVRAEMDLLTKRARRNATPYKLVEDTAHIASSIPRLRAMLLNESPEAIAKLSPPEKWRGRSADIAARCVPFLRNSRPIQRVRLIAPAKTNFVLGLERALPRTTHATVALVCDSFLVSKGPKGLRGYPFLRWWGWPAPKPVKIQRWRNGRWWNFGQIVPDGITPTRAEGKWLNWNTLGWSFTE